MKYDLKHLPYTISKLIGAIIAVIGFSGAIVIVTRTANPSFKNIIPFLIPGAIGLLVFLLVSRLFKKRADEDSDFMPKKTEMGNISVISWLTFLIFIAGLLVLTFIVTL